MARKGSKKKPKPKPKPKKTTPKKKPVKKAPSSAKGSTKSATGLTGNGVTINYRCAGGCRATPSNVHMSPGDVVTMVAVNTDVTINFTGASPFESGADPINIPEGGFQTEIVSAATGNFAYALSCSKCPSGLVPPEMIVP
jgi:hypothetical protein